MEAKEINEIIQAQRKFFQTGQTLPVKFRLEALKNLKQSIISHEAEIIDALKSDLGKSDFESYMCEIGLTLSEITYMLKHTKKFAREKNVHTPLAQFASRSYKKPTPYGTVLIMSPWNYPLLLTLEPLVDALAAGNTVVVKPSAYSPATSAVIQKIITETFAPEYVAVITGGRQENQALLGQKFDFIFFTGSQLVGKEVVKASAEHLTPVVLELGGKSPCIVDSTAKLKLAAKRIVFGKFLNCGQTCVAPDYIWCDKAIKDQLVAEIKTQIIAQFGEKPLQNADFGKIINKKHFDRLCSLINKNKVVHGGKSDENSLKIEPTVLDNVTFDDAVMCEEIFGPILPVMTYENLGDVIGYLANAPKPLALYFFSQDKSAIKNVTSRCNYGGGCINDSIIHLATSEMGFGGVGESGMGQYHGRDGFNAFSHTKSIVNKKTWIDLPMRYQPYRRGFFAKLIRFFLK